MYDYWFDNTDSGVIGVLPCGEIREFSTEEEYWKAYKEDEDDIIEGLAELYDTPVDYPEDWIA